MARPKKVSSEEPPKLPDLVIDEAGLRGDVPEPKAPEMTVQDLGNLIAQGMGEPDVAPQPSNTPESADSPESVEGIPDLRDTSGTVFNRSYHSVDKDGQPKITKSGKFRKKTGAVLSSNPNVPGATQGLKIIDPLKAKRNAEMFVSLLEFGAVQISGPDCGNEWMMGTNEKIKLQEETSRFFIHNGIDDIPPNIAFVLAIGCYALPRLLPGTKTRKKIDEKITAFKLKKEKNKKPILSRQEIEAKDKTPIKEKDKKDVKMV